MILKQDLEKAYDRLEWAFIKDTLVRLGIRDNLRHLIMCCISTTDLCINWQGSATALIKPSRGIWQGDPISPYLFVLCLECLGHSISDAVNSGDWSPFNFGWGSCPKFSHICFADDLILVVKANMGQVQLIKQILYNFCEAFGQKVSFQKSHVFFSGNVQERDAENLSQALGVQLTEDLGRYLGVPMIHQWVSTSSYKFVLDKMGKKLSGWKAHSPYPSLVG